MVKKRREERSWWSWLRPRQGGASDIVVAVPPTANLDIHSSNGDISARQAAGTVTLGTSNGNIEANGGDGVYDLRSSNGTVTIE